MIFGGNTLAYLHMLQINEMVKALKATGIDYISVHFFNRGPYPGPKYNAIQAIVQASGLPPVSDAIGIKSNDALTTSGVLGVGPTFGMAVTSWFGAPTTMSGDRAFPIVDPATGDLNALGAIYQNYITAYP